MVIVIRFTRGFVFRLQLQNPFAKTTAIEYEECVQTFSPSVGYLVREISGKPFTGGLRKRLLPREHSVYFRSKKNVRLYHTDRIATTTTITGVNSKSIR